MVLPLPRKFQGQHKQQTASALTGVSPKWLQARNTQQPNGVHTSVPPKRLPMWHTCGKALAGNSAQEGDSCSMGHSAHTSSSTADAACPCSKSAWVTTHPQMCLWNYGPITTEAACETHTWNTSVARALVTLAPTGHLHKAPLSRLGVIADLPNAHIDSKHQETAKMRRQRSIFLTKEQKKIPRKWTTEHADKQYTTIYTQPSDAKNNAVKAWGGGELCGRAWNGGRIYISDNNFNERKIK